MTADVEILAIGDELLRGIVAESNGHWIAKRVAARGARLGRIVVLPDDPPVVAEELRRALGRQPALVVTHGGLGPTDDDRTREALALGLGVALEPNPEAEEIVTRRYAELARDGIVAAAELTEARRRMSRLPAGARALDNQVGTAPGVVLTRDGTTIVALPGVPPELFWIWEGPLAPVLDETLGPGGFAETTLELEHRDESSLAELLRGVQAAHPDVYVKSRARGFGDGDDVRITLAAAGRDDDDARRLVAAALRDLDAGLASAGIARRTDG